MEDAQGKIKFANIPNEIDTYLTLPNLYTGHCFRWTSATLLADSCVIITTLKHHGGCRSDQVAEGYVEESIQNEYDVTQRITESIFSQTLLTHEHLHRGIG